MPFSLCSQGTFVFAVGPSLKEFTIHKEAFRPLSPYFKTLMDGTMREAREGRVVWDDIKFESFGRLCQFAYANDYSTPAVPRAQWGSIYMTRFGEIPDDDALDKAENLSTWHHIALHEHQALRSETRISGPLTLDFYDKHYGNRRHNSVSRLVSRSAEAGSYIDNLSCNAEVYVLADRYDIQTLKLLALHKLRATLLFMKFSYIKEISSVVQYAVANTRTKDDLRKLLAHYVACIIPKRFPEIDTLLDDFPEFAVEVFHLVKAKI
ncbi:hypothetical protein F4779DRAFT_577225 [Xylariaceae sp. FL0662B]|nr:hypothetical protein F4779DRAFT_577225 [Xylariaceae sp. FL0662B]